MKALLILLFPILTMAAESFQMIDESLKMPDGASLAVTYYLPADQSKKYPVLFEMLPYRKDDFFKSRDYALYHYFVTRGFAIAKVDVRGTGGSEGKLPDREYSEQELDDAVQIIAQLAKKPWSDGNVVMWGISWSGFNAIQVAMRRPPALRAILAADATDDLYYDDVHFIDGIFHVDEYHLSILHDNGFPRSPDYAVDEKYFADRFDVKPWIFTYLKNQNDGSFWRKNSLRWQYDKIDIPVFLIGGLLDGYRDSLPRMLENMRTPVYALLGPWNHAWPDNGDPAPQLEWRPIFIDWLKQVFQGKAPPRKMHLFVRDAHLPDAALEKTPGSWREETWPITRTKAKKYFMSKDHALSENAAKEDAWMEIPYRPSAGIELGSWWGEPTGDMRPLDAQSLTFDSAVLTENFEIIGRPRVKLRTTSDQPVNYWVVRVEDVHPSGEVSLVAGAAMSGKHRTSRLEPSPLPMNQPVTLDFELHFTTWTFKPGHKIRIAITNGAFPMFWPLPKAPKAKIAGQSSIELPVVSPSKNVMFSEKPEPRPSHPQVKEDDEAAWPGKTVIRREKDGSVHVENAGHAVFHLPQGAIHATETTRYSTTDADPARSEFLGTYLYVATFGKRVIRYRTEMRIQSDKGQYRVHFTREILQDGNRQRKKTWTETIARK